MATYLCNQANKTIILRPKKKIATEFGMQEQRGLRIKFQDHRFTTEDPEIIEWLDNMITGPASVRWRKVISKVNDNVIKGMKKDHPEIQKIAKRKEELKPQTIQGQRAMFNLRTEGPEPVKQTPVRNDKASIPNLAKPENPDNESEPDTSKRSGQDS